MTKFTKESLIDHNLIDNNLCCPLNMQQIDTIIKYQEIVENLIEIKYSGDVMTLEELISKLMEIDI